jgi:chromosome segregation ATPase
VATSPSHSTASAPTSLRLVSDQTEIERLRQELEDTRRELTGTRGELEQVTQQLDEREQQRAAAEAHLTTERQRRMRAEDEAKAARDERTATKRQSDMDAQIFDAMLTDAHAREESARRGNGFAADELKFLRRFYGVISPLKKAVLSSDAALAARLAEDAHDQLVRRGLSVSLGYDLEEDED